MVANDDGGECAAKISGRITFGATGCYGVPEHFSAFSAHTMSGLVLSAIFDSAQSG
jgi:hypothetical protein